MGAQPPRRASGWAVGWTMFASTMMFLVGTFHVIAGIAGIAEDDIFVSTRNYLLEFDVTTWGWIHLILGLIVVFAGYGLFQSAVWARTVGVLMAGASTLAGFAWMPLYPVWGIIFVVSGIAVIWALTAHGGDITHFDE
jgi:hypothetical protein